MSSWQYAFMFPGSGKILQVAEIIKVFTDNGLEFDSVLYPAIIVDQEGHLEHGDPVNMTGRYIEEIKDRLKNSEQFLIECRNKELFFAISFAMNYIANPHIMIGWPRSIFGTLINTSQDKYLRLVRNVANVCGAIYIIIVNDPPDYFEDRFLELDGQRFLDRNLPSGNNYDIQAVWISNNSKDDLPDGIDSGDLVNVGEGFEQYSIRG